MGAWAQFTLVLSLKTDSGWIGVDVIRLIMKIGDRDCRPLRSAFSHGLMLLASVGFPVPSKRMQLDMRNGRWLISFVLLVDVCHSALCMVDLV